MSRFGKLHRAERKKARKSMGDVARAIGCAVSYVSDVELGRRAPFKLEHILASAREIGCDPHKLVVAASAERGSIEIATQDPRVRGIAATLARSAERLSADDIVQIEEILNRVGGR